MKVALIGYGAMGKIIQKELPKDWSSVIVSPFHLTNLDQVNKLDCLIDFSHPDNLEMICEYAQKNLSSVVIGTTGYNQEQIARIQELSKSVSVIHSSNFSLGITILNKVIKSIIPIVSDFDIEIIEKHHNQKLDSPSGTAKMLLESCIKDHVVVYGRKGLKLRQPKEIGMHSIRGGSIVGEHEVLFLTKDETLSFTHKAQSKTIFALGAITAAKWIIKQKPGLYNMEDCLFGGQI